MTKLPNGHGFRVFYANTLDPRFCEFNVDDDNIPVRSTAILCELVAESHFERIARSFGISKEIGIAGTWFTH